VSYRLLVACDSNPAPYAGGADWPCRAWLTVPLVPDIHEQAALVVAAGWTVDHAGHRCPACTRTLTASRK
jgi:hypothetical protein